MLKNITLYFRGQNRAVPFRKNFQVRSLTILTFMGFMLLSLFGCETPPGTSSKIQGESLPHNVIAQDPANGFASHAQTQTVQATVTQTLQVADVVQSSPIVPHHVVSPFLYMYGTSLFQFKKMANPVSPTVSVSPTVGISTTTSVVISEQGFQLPSVYFPESGHNVGGRFLAFYRTHGGLRIFGLPLTEVLIEDGIEVQYFERARLEIHPEQPDVVQIALLGTILTRDRLSTPPFVRRSRMPILPDLGVFFPETGHYLWHNHYRFWRDNGGVAIFGYPISEPFIVPGGKNQRAYEVQYFERVRFEYHADDPDWPYEKIQLGLLGREYLARQHIAAHLLAPARPVVLLGASTFHFAPAPVSLINVGLAAKKFHALKVMPGQYVSFLNTVGELTAESGYNWGSAIVGDSIQSVIAGGVCYLSTAIYQAVLNAGLDVVERHQHSLLLDDFSHPPGMDSAVFMNDATGKQRSHADLDLVWRNDTADPVMILTALNTNGDLTISIWGYSDGRKTTIREPSVENKMVTGPAVWKKDETLSACEIKQAPGHDGMNVTVQRVVQRPDGTILHQDTFLSHYAPTREIFFYGSGITVTDTLEATEDSAKIAQQACEQARLYHAAQYVNDEGAQQTMTPSLEQAAEETQQPDGSQPKTETQEPTKIAFPSPMPALYGKHWVEAKTLLIDMGVSEKQIFVDNQKQSPERELCHPSSVLSTIPPMDTIIDDSSTIILGVCAEDDASTRDDTSMPSASPSLSATSTEQPEPPIPAEQVTPPIPTEQPKPIPLEQAVPITEMGKPTPTPQKEHATRIPQEEPPPSIADTAQPTPTPDNEPPEQPATSDAPTLIIPPDATFQIIPSSVAKPTSPADRF